MEQRTQQRTASRAAPAPPRVRIAPARAAPRQARPAVDLAPARTGSGMLAAAVAVLVFAWEANALARFIRWEVLDRGIAPGLGLVASCAYLAVLFPLLAPRLRGRLAERGERRAGLWFVEGVLGHALWGPLLIFAGPLCYASFVVAGGAGLVAYRWLNADR